MGASVNGSSANPEVLYGVQSVFDALEDDPRIRLGAAAFTGVNLTLCYHPSQAVRNANKLNELVEEVIPQIKNEEFSGAYAPALESEGLLIPSRVRFAASNENLEVAKNIMNKNGHIKELAPNGDPTRNALGQLVIQGGKYSLTPMLEMRFIPGGKLINEATMPANGHGRTSLSAIPISRVRKKSKLLSEVPKDVRKYARDLISPNGKN